MRLSQRYRPRESGVWCFLSKLKEHKKSVFDEAPLIVSILANSAENFAKLANEFESAGFLGHELNLSCPHVSDVGSEIGSDSEDAASIVRAVKAVTEKPVLAKMPSSINNVPEWGKMVETASADGIVAFNTIRAMKIEIECQKPVLSNRIGGLSGPAIKPIAIRCIYELFESVDVPVIGVGGAICWQDAIEFFLRVRQRSR